MNYFSTSLIVASLTPSLFAEELEKEYTNTYGIKMVEIPKGEFTMGSPAGEKSRGSDENQVKVTISEGFWIGATEITQGQWEKVTGISIGKLIETKIGALGRGAKLKKTPSAVGENQPMCFVSYADVLDFCKKLTALEKESGKIPEGYAYSIPTEAQWEYAAKAGTTTVFAFGDSLNGKQACFYGPKPYNSDVIVDYTEKTAEVASYEPNAWGLYDTHGNVYEWCLDWYVEQLPGGTDPASLTEGDSRSIRGGAYNRPATSSRSSYRYSYDHTQRTSSIGFRIVLVKE